jgi:hypothetical protein
LFLDDLSVTDLADAIALPSFFSVDAVAAMEKVVSKANEINKKEREEMIMKFILRLLCTFSISHARLHTVRHADFLPQSSSQWLEK